MARYYANYNPYVTVKGKKIHTANVGLFVSSTNRKEALNEAISTLKEQGYENAETNKKYITLEKVV